MQQNKQLNKQNNEAVTSPQKPITVARAEFVSEMVDLINGCGLPPFVIESVIKDLYSEVKVAAKEQYEYEKKQYEQALVEMQAQLSTTQEPVDNTNK